jgi:hypothetical protein
MIRNFLFDIRYSTHVLLNAQDFLQLIQIALGHLDDITSKPEYPIRLNGLERRLYISAVLRFLVLLFDIRYPWRTLYYHLRNFIFHLE